MNNWSVDVVTRQEFKEAPAGMHPADTFCYLQECQNCIAALQTHHHLADAVYLVYISCVGLSQGPIYKSKTMNILVGIYSYLLYCYESCAMLQETPSGWSISE